MFTNLKSEIPTFLSEQVIYGANIVIHGKHKSTLVLTKQLQLYEFKKKLLLNEYDLNDTCLAKERERVNHLVENVDCIKLGKYVYKKNFSYNNYILLQCWQELVALQISQEKRFILVGEWSNVRNFQLIHGSLQYQPLVQIVLENEEIIKTDFQLESTAPINDIDFRKQFENSIQRVEKLKTELEIQKEFTKRDLQQLRNKQYFGNHLVRSSEMEELQPMTRYGGIWMRLTPADKLVIGVPLVNNCTAPNLTTIKNIEAILFNVNPSLEKFNYKYRLYQLQQRFEDLETIESFFQADENELCQTHSWESNNNYQLLPEGFAVLVITYDISDLVLIQTICPLIISYEIEKNIQLVANKPTKLKVFKQQLFVKALNFSKIISSRKELKVNFEAKTLHQDLLAICSSHFELKLHITFKNSNDAAYLEQLLRKTFDCERVKRSGVFNQSDMDMDFDEDDTHVNHFPHMLLYNNKLNDYWYGLLVICEESKSNSQEMSALWKFYAVNEARGLMLMRIILDEFLREKINVQEMILIDVIDESIKSNSEASLINALNLELALIIDILSNINNLSMEAYVNKMTKLTELQLSTDLAMCATSKKCETLINSEQN